MYAMAPPSLPMIAPLPSSNAVPISLTTQALGGPAPSAPNSGFDYSYWQSPQSFSPSLRSYIGRVPFPEYFQSLMMKGLMSQQGAGQQQSYGQQSYYPAAPNVIPVPVLRRKFNCEGDRCPSSRPTTRPPAPPTYAELEGGA